MAKNNIRSIRFNEELAQMIDLQPGRTFTEKFEALITKCCWELPGKEAELEQINQQIAKKQKQLQDMVKQARDLGVTISELSYQTKELTATIDRAVQVWDM